ncbi:MAG: xanthine dehydrogenase family protein molybdopterin-binding subunit [Williamsia sp.]|nr:xanthine dehydrogenase family protein molybdopterin-binding subunit [Williamsia sp.]
MSSTNYVGKPVSRVDGYAKVTGQARYAVEHHVPNLLYGFIVNSAIAKGSVTTLDTSEALKVPGVVQVFTHKNTPSLAWFDRSYKDQDSVPGSPFRPLHSEKIRFSMQPIALVVAETFELARYASTLLKIEYKEESSSTNLSESLPQAHEAPKGKEGYMPPKSRGHAKKAFSAAPVKIQAEYIHGAEHHNPMEMHGSMAIYEKGGKLLVYDKTQGVANTQEYVKKVFGLSKDDVRVLSPYVGGAFGSGLRPQYQLFMAVLAALELKQSVKVSLTRQQMFSFGHRPKSLQRLALSAASDGTLQSIEHTCYSETSRFEDYTEVVVNWSGLLYQCANVELDYQLVKLDVYTPIDMRAPGAVTGIYALECAMDELAVALNIDPLDLRLRNYAPEDQNEKKPFSSKELRACYLQGAEKFGWNKRNKEPRSMREGNQLVGWGMASASWDAQQQKCAAKALLTPDGKLTVSSGTADIGTGTYTIMTQIAAETLGLPIEQVEFKLGDSSLPEAPLEGGSWTAVSVGSAVKATCEEVGQKLLKLAKKKKDSPLANAGAEDVVFENGYIILKKDPAAAVSILDIIRDEREDIEVESAAMPGMIDKLKYSFHSHSAVFAEVKVDEDLGTIHVTRVVSAIAGGRVLNPKTARSQILGAVVWGISMALQEDSVIDHNFGRFMNHNYAEYHVPVNADIQNIEVIFVEEEDDIINPLGAKGLGEIGIVGVAGAIANAVYHATGKRIRKLPIQLDNVLSEP